MICESIRKALSDFNACEDTLDGARVATHCLYPSFETVQVYVVKMGDGYKVHDGAGAYRSAWGHGRDEGVISRALSAEASRFHLGCFNDSLISAEVPEEWLQSVILSVANASSFAANRAVARFVQAAEEALIEKIDHTLAYSFGQEHIARNFSIRGKSGGERHFDFALRNGDDYGILINGVSPHHASINSKYVAFSDTDGTPDKKFAVFEKTLESDDTALLQQVASIVPLASLAAGARRAVANAY